MADAENPKAVAGDNSGDTAQRVAAGELKSFIERVERLEEEKKAIADDVKDVYGEAKGKGYDTKIMRRIVALRKMDANEREEQGAILDLYASALGVTGVFL